MSGHTISLYIDIGDSDPDLFDEILDRVTDLCVACGGKEIEYTYESWCEITAKLEGSDESISNFSQSVTSIESRKENQ